jgi:alginate O-acetyltransferase complex protein AlgI
MLFNSFIFIFLFLPLLYAIWNLAVRHGGERSPTVILLIGSMFFYAWYRTDHLLVLVGSILFNLIWVSAYKNHSRWWLATGIITNLALLASFKYVRFFSHNFNYLLGTDLHIPTMELPLGISFFTFQQIAWLIDIYSRKAESKGLLKQSLFISFFPQLIAGPIVHHRELIPQFTWRKSELTGTLTTGLCVFSIGLFKKVVIADSLSPLAEALFDGPTQGALQTSLAWIGTLAYSFQLYFDFSGYSDMAIGLGLIFGIRLPVNFLSPYKSCSPTEFWRRWHITLSTFIRDYLYIPLGGNRCSVTRHFINLMITMALCGFWHGAGWNFIAWGLFHGGLLVLQRLLGKWLPWLEIRCMRPFSILLCFIGITLGWVLFRSHSLSQALEIYLSLITHDGWGASNVAAQVNYLIFNAQPWLLESLFDRQTLSLAPSLSLLGLSASIAWFLPNTQEWFKVGLVDETYPTIEKPSLASSFACGLLMTLSLVSMTGTGTFLYYQF